MQVVVQRSTPMHFLKPCRRNASEPQLTLLTPSHFPRSPHSGVCRTCCLRPTSPATAHAPCSAPFDSPANRPNDSPAISHCKMLWWADTSCLCCAPGATIHWSYSYLTTYCPRRIRGRLSLSTYGRK